MKIKGFWLEAVKNRKLSPILLYELTNPNIEFNSNPYYSDDVNTKSEELLEELVGNNQSDNKGNMEE